MKQNHMLIRRVIMIIAFYIINFALWKVLVGFVLKGWAYFIIYVILFFLTILLMGKPLKEELKKFIIGLKTERVFFVELMVFVIIYFVLGGIVLLLASTIDINIIPQNNYNICKKLRTIPIFLTFIQTCFLAPVVEETVFRYSIIGELNKESRARLITLGMISVVLFSAIKVNRLSEFFYYLVPSTVLANFYIRRKSVIASIILHSLVNIISIVVLLY